MSEKRQTENNGIKAVQGLRGMACLMIVLSHCGFLLYIGDGGLLARHLSAGGPAGVSIFIMLSGCLVGLRYVGKERSYAIKKHLFKLYPLHIITMIAMAFYLHKYGDPTTLPLKSEYFITNILMIQSFIPDPSCYFSLNAVAWYMSLNAFFCLMTPLILWIVERTKKYSIEILGIILVILVINMYTYKDSALMHYYIYVNPFARIFEYLAGIYLGYIIVEHPLNWVKHKYWYQITEICGLILLAASYWLYTKLPAYITLRILFFPIAMILVYSAVKERGFFSKYLLANKVSVYIGNISGVIFLMQLVVIHGLEKLTDINKQPWISLLAVILICVIVSSIYNLLSSYLKKRAVSFKSGGR